jgi:hypothetical protein
MKERKRKPYELVKGEQRPSWENDFVSLKGF